MKKILSRLIISFVLLTGYLLLATTQAQAVDNFKTGYDVNYQIDETGTAHVTMKVSLTNTTSQYFASSYKVHIGFDDLTNITASDPNGPIQPVITKTPEGQTIGLTFNKKVVGKDNTLQFTVLFDTKDVAQKRGSIWSVTIPGIADQKEFSDFVVKVEVPQSFGSPAFIKPKKNDASYTFSKEELGNGGISMAFGTKQAFDFFLTYHLRNKNVFPIKTEIALPPGTSYQEVLFSSIDPLPDQVREDKDGNWLASYKLDPSEKFDVIVRGKAYVSLTPTKEVVSEADLKDFLKEDNYWQTADPEVKKLASELKTPKAIYDYVTQKIEYDYGYDFSTDQVKPRLGALGVLKNPKAAACLEFTDLFITIARAAGIPAREVDGYAYTENDRQRPLSLLKDILHSWPEYYDTEKQTWVMIDPTWGSTTEGIDYFTVFDFDHFAFVLKGVSSEYPVPAGAYKFSAGDEGKDVHVEFGKIEAIPPQKISLLPEFEKTYLSFFPVTGNIVVRNAGPGVSQKQQISITSQTLSPRTQQITVPEILPFGTVEVPVTFDKVPFLTNEAHTFTIQLAGQKIEQTIAIVPIIFSVGFVIGGIIFGISSIIILIFAYKTGRLPLSRRK